MSAKPIHLFESQTCSICGGTTTEVSETEAVCFSNEQHRRKLVGVARILPFDSQSGELYLACYDGQEPVEITAAEAKALARRGVN
jgi:hypothetical protein